MTKEERMDCYQYGKVPTQGHDIDGLVDELWQDLLERDDRTSPEEYSDMALIKRDEFRDALLAAYEASKATPAAAEEAVAKSRRCASVAKQIHERLIQTQDGPKTWGERYGSFILQQMASTAAFVAVYDTPHEAITAYEASKATPTPSPLLWCCHVRGPDDVHPAPDYQTALKWSDMINDWSDKANAKFKDDEKVMSKAAPALWPWSPESHAQNLAKAIADFSPRLPKENAENEHEPAGQSGPVG